MRCRCRRRSRPRSRDAPWASPPRPPTSAIKKGRALAPPANATSPAAPAVPPARSPVVIVRPPPAAIRPADPAHLLHIGGQRVRRQPIWHGRGAAGGESNGTQRRRTRENILETVHVQSSWLKQRRCTEKDFVGELDTACCNYNLNLVNEY